MINNFIQLDSYYKGLYEWEEFVFLFVFFLLLGFIGLMVLNII